MFKFIVFILCAYVLACVYSVPNTFSALSGKKRVLDPLELEVERVVSLYVVLGLRPGFSGKAASASTTEIYISIPLG